MTQDEVNLGQAGVSAVVRFVSLPGGLQRCFVLLHRETKVPLRHLHPRVADIQIRRSRVGRRRLFVERFGLGKIRVCSLGVDVPQANISLCQIGFAHVLFGGGRVFAFFDFDCLVIGRDCFQGYRCID